MGAKFSQILVAGPNQSQLVEHLGGKGLRGSVGPSMARYTVLAEEQCETLMPGPMLAVCKGITREFGCSCLGIVLYDDDDFLYQLFTKGELVDEYRANPASFGGARRPPSGGDVDVLATAFRLTDAQKEDARRALHSMDRTEPPKEMAIPEDVIRAAFRSGDDRELRERIMRGAKFVEQEFRAGRARDVFDRVMVELRRYREFMAAIGAPEYAVKFRYGQDFPDGVLHVAVTG